jgi:non-lysosomal glucosylceramidase
MRKRFKLFNVCLTTLMLSLVLSCNNQAKKSGLCHISNETMVSSQSALSGVALGGIGAGSIELRKDGIFHNWQIANSLPRGTGMHIPYLENSNLFFVVRFQEGDKEPRLKLLQIENGLEVAAIKNHVYCYPWISGVEKTTYKARFPFVYMTYSDPDMPFDVEMEAFSPFIPHDMKNSTLPGIYFNFKIIPKSDKPVNVMLMACYRNLVGYDSPERTYKSISAAKENYLNTTATSANMDTTKSSFGDISLASSSAQSTYYLGWEHIHPYYEIVLRNDKLPNIDDTDGRNMKDKGTGKLKAMERCFKIGRAHV